MSHVAETLLRICNEGSFSRWAEYSPDEKYRYSLCWEWSPAATLLFVLLNPSTATERKLDATVTRCMQRAMAGKYGSIGVVNLFAYRSTDPDHLGTVEDPVGPDNDFCIGRMLDRVTGDGGDVICGWGSQRGSRDRAQHVLKMIRAAGLIPMALRVNKDGSPMHPLYIRKDATPQAMPE